MNVEAESGELADQTLGLSFGGAAAIKLVAAEIVMFGAVLEDVIGGGED
jgi:hypothetical protein